MTLWRIFLALTVCAGCRRELLGAGRCWTHKSP